MTLTTINLAALGQTVNLGTEVTGTLPTGNGGTGSTATTFVNAATNVTGTLPSANLPTVPVTKGGTGLTAGTTDQFLKFTGTTTVASAAVVAGLEEADQWRISSEFTGAANPPTNWERNDTYSDKVGTGLSVSNGYFSFPSTGIYWIDFRRYGYCPNKAANIHTVIKFTHNNSNYTTVGLGYGSTQPNSQDPSNNDHYNSHITATVDVTDTSLNKVYFGFSHYGSVSSLTSSGNSDANYSHATFLKLGAT